MRFEEALQALRDGKIVRPGKCKCGYVMDASPNYNTIIDMDGSIANLLPCDILDEEWEIV